MRVDRDSDLEALVETWHAFGKRTAVTVGASVALLSLLSDAPVRVASWRGGFAWLAVMATTAAGAWFARRTWVTPEPEDPESLAAEAADPTGAPAAPRS